MTRVPPVALSGDAFCDVVREEIAMMFRKYDSDNKRGEAPEYTLGVRIGYESALRGMAWRLGLTTRQFDALRREVRLLGDYKGAPRQADLTDEELSERETEHAARDARRPFRKVG